MAELVAPIGTREIAEKRGIHRSTAWKILNRLREKHGPRTVSEDGGKGKGRRRLTTSLKALHDADPHMVQLEELERAEIEAVIAKRFRERTLALEKTNADLQESVKALKLQVKELLSSVSNLTDALMLVLNRSDSDSKG